MRILAFVIILLFFAILLAVPSAFYAYGTQDTVRGAVIVDKERVTTGESSRYLIFSETEVFENTDSLFHLKFLSSDVYRDINIGDVCDFQVYGWRVGFLSMYRNIISADCTSSN